VICNNRQSVRYWATLYRIYKLGSIISVSVAYHPFVYFNFFAVASISLNLLYEAPGKTSEGRKRVLGKNDRSSIMQNWSGRKMWDGGHWCAMYIQKKAAVSSSPTYATNQPTDRPTNQPTKPTKKQTNRPTNQPTNKSTNQQTN